MLTGTEDMPSRTCSVERAIVSSLHRARAARVAPAGTLAVDRPSLATDLRGALPDDEECKGRYPVRRRVLADGGDLRSALDDRTARRSPHPGPVLHPDPSQRPA